MIPEFIGRLPIIFTLRGLTRDMLVKVMAFLLLAPTGTSISAPSRSFSIPCWTLSPLTSRVLVHPQYPSAP